MPILFSYKWSRWIAPPQEVMQVNDQGIECMRRWPDPWVRCEKLRSRRSRRWIMCWAHCREEYRACILTRPPVCRVAVTGSGWEGKNSIERVIAIPWSWWMACRFRVYRLMRTSLTCQGLPARMWRRAPWTLLSVEWYRKYPDLERCWCNSDIWDKGREWGDPLCKVKRRWKREGFDGLNVYSGIGKATNLVHYLDTKQYLEMRKEAFRNDGMDPDPAGRSWSA